VATTHVSDIVFAVEPWAPTGTLLTPVVDGRSFVDVVTEYEEGHGWEGAGIHEGLVLGKEDFRDLPQYLLHGRSLLQFGTTAGTVLLGCSCGIVDDGPFLAQVLVTDEQVTWHEFKNPMADGLDCDYSDLDPFVFDRGQYEHAIADAMAQALR
jgi:hypothetical protein